jgi:hypothetical protein
MTAKLEPAGHFENPSVSSGELEGTLQAGIAVFINEGVLPSLTTELS